MSLLSKFQFKSSNLSVKYTMLNRSFGPKHKLAIERNSPQALFNRDMSIV